MKKSFDELFQEQKKFSLKTFGIRPHTAPLHHLKKEVDELLAEPYDDSEFADCMLLLMDAWWRKGGTSQELIKACLDKQEINKNRTWGEPTKEGYSNHLRTQGKPESKKTSFQIVNLLVWSGISLVFFYLLFQVIKEIFG